MGYGGLSHFNQMVCSAFDQIFELAEQADLRIMLVLDDNDEHHITQEGKWIWHNWPANPYNRLNGGPCEKPLEIFTNEQARQAYRKRLRYVMARWGYSPSLWAINVWNDRPAPPPNSLPWLKEMRDYTHEVAGAWRPVIFGTNFQFDAQPISDYAQALEAEIYPGKPNVKQEAYYTRSAEWFVDTLRFELWKHLSRGYGGVMVWPHPQIDQHDAWPVFGAVKRFVADLPLNAEPFAPVQARVTSARIDESAGGVSRILALQDYGDIPNWGARATRDRFEVDIASGSQFLPGMARKLYSSRRNVSAWRTEPTFVFDLPAAGSFVVEIRELSGRNTLLVRDRGERLMEIEIPGSGRRMPVGEERYLRIPLAAGRHELTLSLEGDDAEWLDIRQLLVVYEEPDAARLLTVYGMASDRHAMLYLRNGTAGELPQTFLQKPAVQIDDVRIEITGLAAGRYATVVYDIDNGRDLRRSVVDHPGGALEVDVGKVDPHVAVKVVSAEQQATD
jgi:hypothetical protein